MTIEKLQKVATAAVDAQFKARWLRWWNSGTGGRKAYRFPDLGFSDLTFDSWLAKATFWAQVIKNSNINIVALQFMLFLLI
jgi:phage baseplate assembly protein gpV